MNTLTQNPRIIAILAIAMALVQHAVTYISALVTINQNTWLIINLAEAIVMVLAWNLLKHPHPTISRIILAIALLLLTAATLENFIFSLTAQIWAFNSTLLVFGLILSAIYLLKNE